MRIRGSLCYCGSGHALRDCHGRPRGNAVQTLDDTQLVVRPVFGRLDSAEYPLSLKGSCCIVRFRGDFWIVTAEHVLRHHGVGAEDIRIPVETRRGQGLHFFTTISTLQPIDRDTQDTAWLDLRLIRIERGQRPFGYIDLDVELLAPLDTATFDDAVRIIGYPASLDTGIDYERLHVALESFGVDGAYWGLTSSRFLHAVIFDTFGRVSSLDGMSGGPAFFAKHRGTRFFFAGTIVRGSVESRRVHFIDARAIVKTLRWHYEEDPDGPSAR